MKAKKIITVGLLCVSFLLLNSCVLLLGAAAGAGTIAYVDGKYSMNLEGSITKIYNAALEAIQNNNDLVITAKTITATQAMIKGSTKTDSTDFYVQIDKITDNASKVTIKFGTFGDQAMSSTLMDQIQKNAK
ncbi:DUF3568 family protein [Allofrancisella frigidaquae]|uniref:DUF3568 family protein n=1 Tax=Allofrancisella frigidaquae TaxID=1085644 RepID=A0A6M3HRS4_9GAMM|nr:DUF3568 family protein [Allofrancisella frigidaquae]KEI35032.1 hypothetical protein FRA_43c11090 [Francisella sp. W12-1067]QIV93859.1 DUF3568 family protein [Allofrancisella frigidaquae]